MEKRIDVLTPEQGAMYMEMVAALVAMMGETEVFIPEDKLPMRRFAVWRRVADEETEGRGIVIRVVRD